MKRSLNLKIDGNENERVVKLV